MGPLFEDERIVRTLIGIKVWQQHWDVAVTQLLPFLHLRVHMRSVVELGKRVYKDGAYLLDTVVHHSIAQQRHRVRRESIVEHVLALERQMRRGELRGHEVLSQSHREQLHEFLVHLELDRHHRVVELEVLNLLLVLYTDDDYPDLGQNLLQLGLLGDAAEHNHVVVCEMRRYRDRV